MLKGHPKGLLIAFFANMGERFGFYTMMAILVLFLQAKYGFDTENAGYIYATFYFLIYALALVGGFIADKYAGLGKTIFIGIVVMLSGYVLMAVPGGLYLSLAGLFTIAFGNGLFKGNLQALVGNLYEAEKYKHLRDSAFSIFYMGINVGAFFAPSAAKGVKNWYLEKNGLLNDDALPSLAHRYIDGSLETADIAIFQNLADKANQAVVTDLGGFAQKYIDVFSTGYHYAFGIAALAMVISFVIYMFFKSHLAAGETHIALANDTSGSLDTSVPLTAEEKQRLLSLGLVFLVVIFFWMSFHQNGLTLTMFARDYTVNEVGAFTYMFFDIYAFLSIIAVIIGFVLLVSKKAKAMGKGIGAGLIFLGGYLTYYFYTNASEANGISPETFQHFNPIFIVFLTPLVVAFFAWLNKRNIEPSSPRKIGIGMILASIGFVVLLFGSLGLTSPSDLGASASPDRVSAYWLVGTYFVLTVSELFLSPIGISFVSKVAPARYKGLMQGGWLGATALGNQLLFVGTLMWANLEVWQVWGAFVFFTAISAIFIFTIMKRLEKATGAVS